MVEDTIATVLDIGAVLPPEPAADKMSNDGSISIKQNTQKGKKEIQDKIIDFLSTYSKALGIDHWTLLICFKKLGSDVLAECEAETEYYRAVISFDTVKLEEQSEEKQRKTVVHELLHCLVWQLAEVAQHLAPDEHKEFIQRFEERVTTDLERMPVWDLVKLEPKKEVDLER